MTNPSASAAPPSPFEARPYDGSARAEWNRLVAASKNGHFLHSRDYLEYHRDRFEDCSLLAYRGDDPIAVFPACRQGKDVTSHAGLTYGGLLYGAEVTALEAAACLDAIARAYRDRGAEHLECRRVPSVFCSAPADEDEHWLLRAGAVPVRSHLFSVIERGAEPARQRRRVRGARRGAKAGLELRFESGFAEFWETVLVPLLRERHGTPPVHSAAEIERLGRQFPEQIRLATVRSGGSLVAGSVLYVTKRMLHTQYIASTEAGRDQGALDWLFTRLIDEYEPSVPYFSFGTSARPDGELDAGLLDWKEGFGARAVVACTYRLDLRTLPVVRI